ncbi:MAG: Rpn family recombination-promoting nuclease/putative transposase [Saprospiraceae bacterium]|nr:Rpn family recombination-promoting nuclease/putative transposase [Saprospiraceae bacterium]MDW8228370.1 Rpn family recombination-promoting nuclease/putative transposase [Saprospiraceae bacterium]
MTRKLVRFDWALKRLLRNKANFDVLEGFLSELLREDVRIKQILESKGNKETWDDEFNRVDILVENEKGELVIVEIQNTREADYFQRMLYGTAKVITEHMTEGQPYAEVKKVYSVNIVYFDLGQGDDYVYHGTTHFIGLHSHTELALSARQREMFQKTTVSELYPEYYIIKTNRFDEVARDTLDEWIYFLKTAEIKEEFTAKGLKAASQKLDVLKLDPADRKAYERYLEAQRDEASFALTVRAEVEAAVQEALQEAVQGAVQEAVQEAVAQEKGQIAEQALREGATVQFVARITGLSLQEVQAIADKLKSGGP